MAVTVGILGAGRIAGFHAEGIRRAGAEIIGVADVRPDAAAELAERFGGIAVAGEDELIRLRPDVIVIATPHDLHVPQAMRALRAGIDVYLDKPLALTSGQGLELVQVAAHLGRNLGVNHNLLFHPAVIEGRRLVSGIGRLVSASAWSEGWLDITPWDFRRDRFRTGGGAWFDAGPHLLYTLDALAGPFADLCGLAASGPSRLGGEDTVGAVGRFANGAIATLRVSYAHSGPGSRLAWPAGWQQGFELHGTQGALRILVTPTGQVESMEAEDRAWSVRATDLPFAASFWRAIGDFLDSRTAAGSQDTARKSVHILKWIERTLATPRFPVE
jgi:UDP-N-acetylglucosamine 3-dehydrogenase